MSRKFPTLAAFLLLSLPALAQRAPFPIPDPDPEIERKSFIVADGFEVNLFAADPLLAKPIQMNFDAKGRLWVASSEVYPQIMPGQVANDKILILEDLDGDGKADRTTIFADGLLIPTGVEPGDGGAYIANSTELLHLKDTDGDGKADTKRIMLSGFGTEDTHHILHTLRWGPDGNLYMNQSIYIHSHIETPYGVKRLNGGGTWRFRPETMELDVFIRGLVNSWGHAFDAYGQSFATDGAGGEGINYALPGAYYLTAPDAVRILKGLNPGSPKHCALELASGRHLPEEWEGNLLTNDFRGNRVCRFVISEDGAGFSSREQPELIKTSHMAFRPIDIKLGPDGAIYIADWYNPIIQHGEVDFRDPRRDHTRGRIWRVTAKNRPLAIKPDLLAMSTPQLLFLLQSPEGWTRHFAKRVLKERGAADVEPALVWWMGQLDAKSPTYERDKLEALWTYQSVNVVAPALLADLLEAKDGRVRAAAVRVASQWASKLSDPVGLLTPRVTDEHPRVRLEAVRAFSSIDDNHSAEIALRALDKPVDTFLDYALWLTARQTKDSWLPGVEAGQSDLGDVRKLIFALESVGSPEVVKPLMAALTSGKIPKDREESVLSLMATLGAPKDLAAVLELALAKNSTTSRRVALLTALNRATTARKVQPEGDLARIVTLLADPDDSVRAAAARALGGWKVGAARPKLVELATADATSRQVRQGAIEGLSSLGGADSIKVFETLAASQAPVEVRALAVAGLAPLDLKAAGARAVDVLSSDTKNAVSAELMTAFLTRQGGAQTLTAALAGKTLPRDVAQVALRTARGSGKPEPALIDAISTAGKLAATSGPPTVAEVDTLVAAVRAEGDAARGEALYRRNELQCLKCHAIAGAGGIVGPGLESIGASAQIDYLIYSLLEPTKAVKEGYHAITVATQDGQIFTGIKIRQSERELFLRDADGNEKAIPLANIEEQKPAGSIMPAGLVDSLTKQELVDLVRFLSELGKVGPYSVAKTRVVRRWQTLEPTAEAATVLIRDRIDAATKPDPIFRWLPIYSEVSGDLPLDALPKFNTAGSDTKVGFARAQLEVTTGGPVRLIVNDPKTLKLWVDQTPIILTESTIIDVTSGVHNLTYSVDLTARRGPLRVTLEDIAGSPARAQIVLGK